MSLAKKFTVENLIQCSFKNVDELFNSKEEISKINNLNILNKTLEKINHKSSNENGGSTSDEKYSNCQFEMLYPQQNTKDNLNDLKKKENQIRQNLSYFDVILPHIQVKINWN